MTPWITRVDAWSAAGRGVGALADAMAAGRSLARPVPWDQPGLRSPFACLADAPSAEVLLDEVVRGVLPPEGGCGLVVATTSGAITGEFERWHAGGGGLEQAWRQAPTRRVAARHGLAPATTVSVACASGSQAFAIARGWLRDGICARVVVAGVDALGPYVHAGFGGLGALSPTAARPFAPGRDGLVLGEGAAAFLLETPASARAAGRAPLAALRGVGVSQDAVHLTAPDRTGGGLARAIAAALGGLDPAKIGAVSAHGTATPFNDAMEARALARTFGDVPVPAHAPKAVIGHTLGAAGALEAAALLAVMNGADAPAPPADVAEDCPVRFGPAHASPRWGLSVNAAFGGVNVAVLFGPPGDDDGPAPRPVSERARASLSAAALPLAEVHPAAPPTLGRADLYVRAGIAALHRLGPLPEGVAVVLASEGNCRAADHRYHAGLLAGGPSQASRVHFTYTIPGAPLAEASILCGLRGPAFVFCDEPARAHLEARALVSRGDTDAAVALVVEAPGPDAALADAVLYAAPP